MGSCLRLKWQFSESQIAFSALSLTMIIVIEQNIVFSIEVYEGRHLRLYFQSSMYRRSHVSLLNTNDVMQKHTFAHWLENVPHNDIQVSFSTTVIPFLYDFFSINLIPECRVIWTVFFGCFFVFFLYVCLMIGVLAVSVFIKCCLDLFGRRVA